MTSERKLIKKCTVKWHSDSCFAFNIKFTHVGFETAANSHRKSNIPGHHCYPFCVISA
jgi:hypothetical protein